MIHDKKQSGRKSGTRGFTLLELLVVILIIGLLIAILVPVLGYVRDKARSTTTQQRMVNISLGLEQYKTELSDYPPSYPKDGSGSYLYTGKIKSGSVLVAEALLGYLDYSDDGAGPSKPIVGADLPDPALGFRTSTGGRGKIYGPYTDQTAGFNAKTGTYGSIKVYSAARVAFVDAYGNDILYYRASTTTTTKTKVFDVPANNDSFFASTDNTNSSDVVADPTLPMGSVRFYKAVGATAGVNLNGQIVGGSTNSIAGVLGRDSYLLLSAGKDGKYFTDDDQVQAK